MSTGQQSSSSGRERQQVSNLYQLLMKMLMMKMAVMMLSIKMVVMLSSTTMITMMSSRIIVMMMGKKPNVCAVPTCGTHYHKKLLLELKKFYGS